jgi:hypothetical protein
VKLPPNGSEKEIIHLLAKNGTEVVDLHLCPKSFLEEMGVSFSMGDEIALSLGRRSSRTEQTSSLPEKW